MMNKRKRRGRPVLANVSRETNGRLSRRVASVSYRDVETERQTLEVAVGARMRREMAATGEVLDMKQARDPRRGTVLGPLLLDGAINQSQYEAGTRYSETKWAYHALTGIPFPSAKAQDLFKSRGGIEALTDKAIASARGAAARYMLCEGWLLSIANDPHRRCKCAVNTVCAEDEETARFWPEKAPHMIGWLKRGLDALVFGYGLRGNAA